MTTNDHHDAPIPYAIVEYVTRANILNIYGLLHMERIWFELVKYDPGQQQSLARATAYLPVSRVKLLCHLVLTGQSAREKWQLESFGGGYRDGVLESRVFVAQYDPAGGRFRDNPYRLTISVGTGVKTKTGGISPDGEPHTRVGMRFAVNDLMSHCLEIRDYLMSHQHEIEGVRYLAQLQHYEARQQKQPPAPRIPARLAGAYRS